MMCRACGVDDVVARAMLASLVTVAALKDQHFFDADMAMRRITATGLHPNEDGRILRLVVAPQDVNENPLMPRRVPLDC